MKVVEIYSDGSCRGNPGPGTWAFLIVGANSVPEYEESGYCEDTTNNIMELTAVIKALSYCATNEKNSMIYLYTDSQYIQLGMIQWIKKWKQNNWRTTQKKPVANQEHWKKLDELSNKLNIHFQWIRGHAGNKWNVQVDKLCINAYSSLKP
jgi:ribonuclease HI